MFNDQRDVMATTLPEKLLTSEHSVEPGLGFKASVD